MTTTPNGSANHAPLRITTKTAFDHESILTAAMLYGDAAVNAALGPATLDLFADPLHRGIAFGYFKAVADGRVVDPIGIARKLRDDEVESEPFIVERLTDLADFSPLAYPVNVRSAITALSERRANAAMSDELGRVKRDLDGQSITTAEAADRIEAARQKHAPPATAHLPTLADTLVHDPADEVGELIATGIEWFDAILPNAGLSAGDKLALGGAPGSGKSAIALFITIMALQRNPELRAAWALGEMSSKTLRNRALSVLSGLTIGVLRRQWSDLSPLQSERKRSAIDTLKRIGQRLFIVEGPLTPKAITAAVEAKGARLLIVDYLQLVRPDREAANRRDAVDDVVRSLTTLAQRTGVVSLWLSSMPKSAIEATDVFSAFKESSEIAHAVDLAYVLRSTIDADASGADLPDVVDVRLQCLKARHGSPRSITMAFDRCSQQFNAAGGGR